MTRNKVWVHGHRGSRGTHPENLFPSFEEARDAGADFIEFDVHLSADDVPVVFHDEEISAKLCLGADGSPIARPQAVRELTLREIQAFQCGGVLLSQFPKQRATPGEQIPALEQVLVWKKTRAPNVSLNIEIKRDASLKMNTPSPELLATRVVELLRKHGLIEGTLVQSFDHEVVRAARAVSPQLKLSCLFEEPADFAAVAKDCSARVVAIDFTLLTPEIVADCQGRGLEVLPWTVNEPSDWARLLSMGVRSIITDYPRELMRYLSSAQCLK